MIRGDEHNIKLLKDQCQQGLFLKYPFREVYNLVNDHDIQHPSVGLSLD